MMQMTLALAIAAALAVGYLVGRTVGRVQGYALAQWLGEGEPAEASLTVAPAHEYIVAQRRVADQQ